MSITNSEALDAEDTQRLEVVDLHGLLPVGHAGIVTMRSRSLSVPTRRVIDVLRSVARSGGAPALT